MKIKLTDIFNRKALAEKRKEISALTLKLQRAEAEASRLTQEREEFERLRKKVEGQIEAFAKDHMPTAEGHRPYRDTPMIMRITFDFDWTYWHQGPEILREVAFRVVHEALRKCDTWKTL